MRLTDEQRLEVEYNRGRHDERERIIKKLEFFNLGEWVSAQGFIDGFILAIKEEARE